MVSLEIMRNPQMHCMLGGNFEEYAIKYNTSVTIGRKEIEDIKNGNISKKDKKYYKRVAEMIGEKIIVELLNHIEKEED